MNWGTLDPIASYVLMKKKAYTRPVAANIASEYWEAIDEVSDAALEPQCVAEWMRRREETRSAITEDQHLPPSEIPVELIEDFSEYAGSNLRVLPAIGEHRIDWYDPAGFLLAQSRIPENWRVLNAAETDFMLDPSASVVTWHRYV